jgi:release factor glutamine methyltransferase
MLSQELYQVFKTAMESNKEDAELRSQWAYIWPFLRRLGKEEDHIENITEIVRGLKGGEPIQYLVGYGVFFDMELKVSSEVLIPRPETEELVYHIVKYLEGIPERVRLLDVGTGSGCIPIAIGRQSHNIDIDACDISGSALKIAKENAQAFYPDITFFEADLSHPGDFDGQDLWDIIVSNPPYIERGEVSHMNRATKFEPDIALFSPEDALWAYRHLHTLISKKLKLGGRVFLELNEFWANDIKLLFESSGFVDVEIILDMQNKERILTAERAKD